MSDGFAFKVFWGDILRDLRKKNHLRQGDIAEMLHISRQAYSNIECGRAHPTPETLALLSDLYNIDLYEYVLRLMPDDYVAEHNKNKYMLNSISKSPDKKKTRKKYVKMKNAADKKKKSEE